MLIRKIMYGMHEYCSYSQLLFREIIEFLLYRGFPRFIRPARYQDSNKNVVQPILKYLTKFSLYKDIKVTSFRNVRRGAVKRYHTRKARKIIPSPLNTPIMWHKKLIFHGYCAMLLNLHAYCLVRLCV